MTDSTDDLERRLDAAYTASRPRPGYDKELWHRLEASRSWWARARGTIAAPGWSRFVPAVAGACALLLVIGIAFGLTRGRVGGAGGAGSASLSQQAPKRPEIGASPAFGKLPPPMAAAATDTRALTPAQGAGQDLSGPMSYVWVGSRLPAVPTAAPVYRYAEPSAAAADEFAARLGAHRAAVPTSAEILGIYAAPDAGLTLTHSSSELGIEPSFALTPHGSEDPGGTGPSDEAARAAAVRFLEARRLAPAWPYDVSVDAVRGFPSVVHLARQFDVPGAGRWSQVTATGRPGGFSVIVKGDGSVFQASGPIPVELEGSSYPVRSGQEAVRALNSRPSPSVAISGGGPRAAMDRVQLVYVVVPDGDRGFYEPAYLFTGTVKIGGQERATSVVVPAVANSELRTPA